QAAMWIDATVAAGFLATSDAADDIGHALAPVGPVAKGNAWLWSWNLAIPTTSEHKDAALQFITWATSKDYIEMVADLNGWAAVPPGTRVSTYERAEYQEAAPFADMVLQSMLNADPTDSTRDPVPYTGVQFVAIPEFQGIGTDVSQYIADALAGNITVEEALESGQAATLEVMEDAGYLDGTAPAAQAAEEPAAEEEAPAPQPREEASLTIATVNNPDMKVMEGLTSEFEAAYPGITLEWVVLPENELRSRVTTDVATGAASFDIVTVGAYETPLWGDIGWIESIDALASANP
ncbi:MAG: extracellular solute-binding protein, partial [Ardenticatenaceae bacterium]